MSASCWLFVETCNEQILNAILCVEVAELTNLQLNLEKEKIMNEQTRHDLEEFKAKADQEKQKLRKEVRVAFSFTIQNLLKT